MNERFVSNGLSLACHIAVPSGPIEPGPAVILCHGFPIASLDAQRAGGTFPQLMDRTAHELGCVAMTFNFRGCGESEGDFSLQGWVDDLRNAISHVLSLHDPTGIIEERSAQRVGVDGDRLRPVCGEGAVGHLVRQAQPTDPLVADGDGLGPPGVESVVLGEVAGDGRVVRVRADRAVDEFAPCVPAAAGRGPDGVLTGLGSGHPSRAGGCAGLFEECAPCGAVAFPGLGHASADATLERFLGGHVEGLPVPGRRATHARRWRGGHVIGSCRLVPSTRGPLCLPCVDGVGIDAKVRRGTSPRSIVDDAAPTVGRSAMQIPTGP